MNENPYINEPRVAEVLNTDLSVTKITAKTRQECYIAGDAPGRITGTPRTDDTGRNLDTGCWNNGFDGKQYFTQEDLRNSW
jgi:hypothetical protein